MTRIWNEELANTGVAFLSLDPGDLDTPMHAAAVPDGDRSQLKRPEIAAAELVDAIGNLLAYMNSARGLEEVHR
jgi:NAD(P)-dependent dehydrogenase (short-subunit alcohol dehydrogenase family)